MGKSTGQRGNTPGMLSLYACIVCHCIHEDVNVHLSVHILVIGDIETIHSTLWTLFTRAPVLSMLF